MDPASLADACQLLNGQLEQRRPDGAWTAYPVAMEPWLRSVGYAVCNESSTFHYEEPERFGESLTTARPGTGLL